MARKKKEERPNLHPDWEISEEMQVNGRWLRPGTEFSVRGERGRMRFVRHVKTPKVEWVDCISTFSKQCRAFRPERIKTVHYVNRTRENQQ